MVFGTRMKSVEKNQNNLRCKSADSGVSVALTKTFKKRIIRSLNDFEEEHLDFEPDFEDEFDGSSENQSKLVPQLDFYSDQSTMKDFNLNCQDVDSNYSTTVKNYSDSNVSIAHIREMLPVPVSDAKDGRQYEYLPLYCTPSVSARTTLDSSSDDGSVNFEGEWDMDNNIQDDLTKDQYSDQSGTTHEDYSSQYSVTQEEEDRLLDSSGEESQDSNLLIQMDLVETCQIGNARITLPKFMNSPLGEHQSNDLKRTKSTARLKTLECKKKKKWDVSFKPEYPVTHVYLNDIGYVAADDGESNTESESESRLSEPPFSSLIVICSKDKVVCENAQGSREREIISLSKNEETNFKLPLPPPKRPPTRPKRMVCNSEVSGTNLQIKFSNKDVKPEPEPQTFTAPRNRNSTKSPPDNDNIVDKSDEISLIASTLGVTDDVANLNDLDVFDSDSNKPDTDSFESQETLHYVNERVKEWVQNVPNPETSSSIPSLLDIIENPIVPRQSLQHKEGMAIVPPVVAITPPVSAKGSIRVNFKEVPNVFSGLCYYYYLSDNCIKARCHLAHVVNVDKFNHKLQKLNADEAMRAFQFAMRFEKLFKDIYPSFINAFGKFKMQNELMTCIKYFLRMEAIDSTEALDLVIKALEESGLAFEEAIEMISFNIGFLEHPVLADSLLDLITRTYDISKNWSVIKRISKARGKIMPLIAKRILAKAMNGYPLNKELCLEIYNTIVTSNMADISQIGEDSLVAYRKLANFSGTSGMVKTVPQIQPITAPNPQEVLAAHIDSNLIKEREYYEREMEGTTVRTKPVPALRNYSYESQHSSYDNRSRTSSSEELYFMPTPRLTPFAQKSNSQPSPNNLNSAFDMDTVELDAVLRFEPPSEIDPYVPEIVRMNDARSEPEVEITLMPSRPIFGRPCYRSDFNYEKSLHNLLPDSFEHVNINERDVAKLNSVIKSKNGAEFYKLLQYYMNPPTVQNFITMTVVNLKSVEGIHDTLISLIKSFEAVNPDYGRDKNIKGVIEVVVMNLLFELEKKGLWNDARNLLEIFCDWDSLVSSKIFSIRRVTPMGRYIFLAKMFAMAKNFHFTYEIMQSPNLKLLESPESWPYFHNSLVDLESRNGVLNEFFKYAHHHYIIGVSDMYRRIFKYGGIYRFDAQTHFNPMLISLINEQQTVSLKYFHPDIDIYYKVMDKNVLRAFTILMADQLDQQSLFRLYELCCERQIYTNFAGGETSIIVRNNMVNEELRLILNYYFHKISESKQVPPGKVTIQIKLLDNKPLYPKILQKCVRSIKEINDNIKKILKDQFSIATSMTTGEQLTTIEILREQVLKWFQCNQMFPVYS